MGSVSLRAWIRIPVGFGLGSGFRVNIRVQVPAGARIRIGTMFEVRTLGDGIAQHTQPQQPITIRHPPSYLMPLRTTAAY